MMLEQIRGNWRQMKGAVQEQWFRLTDDDLEHIDGRLERLVRRIEVRYGVSTEEAYRQITRWFDELAPAA
ncbi:CsbD family protein [Amorphus sp. 3PC139-8]|uniref:CsbD family protein n=1 Tax=Amorphus sp. 3PC139-8 TaxID=2735676 RepID=UPI00345C83FB